MSEHGASGVSPDDGKDSARQAGRLSHVSTIPAPHRAGTLKRIWLSRKLYAFIFPTLALLLTFSYYPAISALVHSFFRWNPFQGETEYLGLANFRQVYADLFTPVAALPGGVFGPLQLATWLVPAMLVLFFIFTEWQRSRTWAGPRALANMVTVVSVALGVGTLLLASLGPLGTYSPEVRSESVTYLVVLLALVASQLAARAATRFTSSHLPRTLAYLLALVTPTVALYSYFTWMEPRMPYLMAGYLRPFLLGTNFAVSAFSLAHILLWLAEDKGNRPVLEWVFGGLTWAMVAGASCIAAGSLAWGVSRFVDAGIGAERSEVFTRFVTGHGLLLAMAAFQVLGWRRHSSTGNAWWWRLSAFATLGAIICGVGMLIKVTRGGPNDDGVLRGACWNLGQIMAFSLTVRLFMPLVIAEVLFHLRSDRWKYIYRVLFIVPMVVPGIVGVMMWRFIYESDGVLDKLMDLLSRPGTQFVLVAVLFVLVMYVLTIKLLGRLRRGDSPGRLGKAMILAAASPFVLAGLYPLHIVRGGKPGFAEFFVRYSLIQLFQNSWVHAGIVALLLAILCVKLVRSLQTRLRTQERIAWPVAGLVAIGLVIVAAVWGFAAGLPEATPLTEVPGAFAQHVSMKSGLGVVGSIELKHRDWLSSTSLALYSIMMMGFPWVGTISMLIFYAGLQAIPTSVLESAKLDGASGLGRFFRIDFPLILGQFKLLLILGIIGGIQNFQNVLILTNGSQDTEMPGLRMFKEAFSYSKLGYGTTIGAVMFLVILGVTYINIKYIRPSAEEETR